MLDINGERVDTRGIEVGHKVRIRQAYRGNGRYESDGATGEWFVYRVTEEGVRIAKHPDGPWTYWVHACRVMLPSELEGVLADGSMA